MPRWRLASPSLLMPRRRRLSLCSALPSVLCDPAEALLGVEAVWLMLPPACCCLQMQRLVTCALSFTLARSSRGGRTHRALLLAGMLLRTVLPPSLSDPLGALSRLLSRCGAPCAGPLLGPACWCRLSAGSLARLQQSSGGREDPAGLRAPAQIQWHQGSYW